MKVPIPPTGGSALASISLENGRTVRTRLLVAADGARSRMRSLAQLRTVQWMYDQKGLVATVRTAEPHATAWQRFLPTGPLALLPVRNGFSNIVWSTSPAQAAELETCSPDAFVAAVNEVSGSPANVITRVSTTLRFGLAHALNGGRLHLPTGPLRAAVS